MRRLSVPVEYKGFSISFDVQLGVSFSDGRLTQGAASYRDARRRIDAIVTDRERRERSASRSGRSGGQLDFF